MSDESKLANKIDFALTAAGCLVLRTHDARHRPVEPGIPDLIIVTPNGRVLFRELKAGRNRVSDAQAELANELARRHADVGEWRSWDEVVEDLSELFISDR
jgi:hypothetical protein